jgi:integrase
MPKRPYGEGSIDQRGKSWLVRWRPVKGRPRVGQSFKTHKLAARFLAKTLGEMALAEAGFRPDPLDTPVIDVLYADWIERRKGTHRSWKDDRSRFVAHILPFLGKKKPAEVNTAVVREFVELLLRTPVARVSKDHPEERKIPNLSSTSVGHCVRSLSTFMADLVERQVLAANPILALPRSLKKLYRNAHDPKDTPILETRDNIHRVFLALPEPYNVMFAVGCFAGLRNAEVIGLHWEAVNFDTQQIHVWQQAQDGELGPLKNGGSRFVPILDSLFPVLRQWRVRTGGVGQMFRPKHGKRGGRRGRPPRFIGQDTLNERLRAVLEALGLWRYEEKLGRRLTWYKVTRHTFGSHWVRDGRPLLKLQGILDHKEIGTTMRYAHDDRKFSKEDLAAMAVDLSAPAGKLVAMEPESTPRAENGIRLGSGRGINAKRKGD